MTRLKALALVVVALTALAVPRALAQSPTTGPAVTVPPTTLGPTSTTAPGSTSSTVPPSIPPQDSAPSTTAPVNDPTGDGDAPAAAPPDPSKVDGVSSVEIPIDTGRAVTVDTHLVASSAEVAGAELAKATAARAQAEATMKALRSRVGALDVLNRRLVTELVAAREELRRRAVEAYVRGGDTDLVEVVDPASFQLALLRSSWLDVMAQSTGEAVGRLDRARRAASQAQTALAGAYTSATARFESLRGAEQAALVAARRADLALSVASAGGDFVIDGFTFPVQEPYSFTDSFGAPRLPGTPFAHWHQGCDIVAPDHAELYATEDGVIRYMLSGGLGGTGIWLSGKSGTDYYYAHLSEYAEDVEAGSLVKAGQLLGYVGSTGDATTPHLHFEVHPFGGAAINPYPLLVAADEDAKRHPRPATPPT